MILVRFTFISIVLCFKVAMGQQRTQDFTHKTKLGTIRGIKTLNNDTVELYRFLNIPYAQSPTEWHRFTKPRPFGSWNRTLNATTYGPACSQIYNRHFVKYGVSEDCLHLNIYAPPDLNKASRKSVMVWVHGGSYTVGTASFYDGSMLAKTGDVIVVTINYRLGLFGFFALKNSTARGNYGLWDQMMAIRWVKDNIDDYGGDPNSITIVGQSAGGFSVGFLALIPQNRDLFHRVIMQSGVPNSSLKVTPPGYDTYVASDSLSRQWCPFFVKNIPMRIICMRYLNSTYYTSQYIPFAPVVDDDLFTQDPERILKDRNSSAFLFFKSLDIIVTNCDTDGSVLFPTIAGLARVVKLNSITLPNVVWDSGAQPMLEVYYGKNLHLAWEVSRFYDFTQNDTFEDQCRKWTELYTDLFFNAPSTEMIDTHSNNISSTFRFIMSRESPIYPGIMYNESSPPEWFHGAAHSDDVVYLFLLEKLQELDPNTTIKATEADLKFASQMRLYWSNFAKTGNPNDPRLPPWPSYNTKNKSFMLLSQDISSENSYRNKEAKFWLEDVPRLHGDITPHSDPSTTPSFISTTELYHVSSARHYTRVFGREVVFQMIVTILLVCDFY